MSLNVLVIRGRVHQASDKWHSPTSIVRIGSKFIIFCAHKCKHWHTLCAFCIRFTHIVGAPNTKLFLILQMAVGETTYVSKSKYLADSPSELMLITVQCEQYFVQGNCLTVTNTPSPAQRLLDAKIRYHKIVRSSCATFLFTLGKPQKIKFFFSVPATKSLLPPPPRAQWPHFLGEFFVELHRKLLVARSLQ